MKSATQFKILENGVSVYVTVGAFYGKKPWVVGALSMSVGIAPEDFDVLFWACVEELGFRKSKRAKSGVVFDKKPA